MRIVVRLLLLSLLISLAATIPLFQAMFRTDGSRAVGDGSDPTTYGFDLDGCLIPTERIIAGGIPKDGITVLNHPPLISAERAESFRGRDKYLVPTDRVIGVEIDGQARAYPLMVMDWHEIANDTLAGHPIAVTFSPLSDAMVVYERLMEGDTLRFGVSGLLYNSNLLFYDQRSDPTKESLWIQIDGRAVSGPAARHASRLSTVAAELVQWADWRSRHPETTVIARETSMLRAYRRKAYSAYFGNDELRFDTSPLPPRDLMPYKTPLIVIEAGGERGIFPLPALASRVGEDGVWRTEIGGAALDLHFQGRPATAWVESVDPSVQFVARYALWFAWHAMHPQDKPTILPD